MKVTMEIATPQKPLSASFSVNDNSSVTFMSAVNIYIRATIINKNEQEKTFVNTCTVLIQQNYTVCVLNTLIHK